MDVILGKESVGCQAPSVYICPSVVDKMVLLEFRIGERGFVIFFGDLYRIFGEDVEWYK